MAKVPYASVVGSLIYAMVCMGPDISHALGVDSRFMSNLGKEIVKRSCRYNIVLWRQRNQLAGLCLFEFCMGS